MNKQVLVFLFIFILGAIIIVVPDSNNPVIELNENHGPSFIDLIGLLFIAVTWVACLIMIVNQWKKIADRSGKKNTYLLAVFYFLFLGGVIIALTFSVESMLWLSAAAALFINIVFIYLALKAKKTA